MIKTRLVSFVICALAPALGLLAQDRISVYEHLAWVQTGYGEVILETDLDNPNPYSIQSNPFLSFHVPASPKAQAMFFELWGQSRNQWWVGYEPQSFSANVKMQIISDLIPADIEVYMAHGLTTISGITHNDATAWETNKRTWKVMLRRDSMLRTFTDWWDIRFISTGQRVPNDAAQGILNRLMDNGFDAALTLNGNCQGVKAFFFYAFQVEVTRLVRKQ